MPLLPCKLVETVNKFEEEPEIVVQAKPSKR